MELALTMNKPFVEVQFISVEPQKASFKIGILPANNSLPVPGFVHLPPFHKLRRSHVATELLKKTTVHRVKYSDDIEPLVTNLDGVDLYHLWLFIYAKEVCSLHCVAISNT